MIKFRYVVDAQTGDKYYVSAVKLMNDEGYDQNLDSAANMYEIDLQPCDEHCRPFFDVPLVVEEHPGAAPCYCIAQDWNPPKDAEDARQLIEVTPIGCVLVFNDTRGEVSP